MQKTPRSIWPAIAPRLLLSLPLLASLATFPAQAQITSDGSLNTTVLTSGPNAVIVNGQLSGDGRSLFHSFSQFSIPSGGSASFNLGANPGVSQIFSRVTGPQASQINGVLQTLNSSGPVSLFLLNPQGIVFGPNAILNLGGSFGGSLVASTATSLEFAGGTRFEAIAAPLPLLTVSTPVGLQFAANAAASITVQGSGHTLAPSNPQDSFGLSPLVQASRPGLQLRPNNTLALVGGQVQFSDGVAAAAQGRLEVGAVTQGRVGITPTALGWSLDYGAVQRFGNVQLQGRSLLDVGGVNAGSIQLRGRRIQIEQASLLLSQNVGPQAGGMIQVSAAESLEIRGSSATGQQRSGILSQSLGLGQGSDIQIQAPQVSLADGAGILATNYQQGISGAVRVTTADLKVQGFARVNPLLISSLGVATLGPSDSNNLWIEAERIRVSDGGAIASTTFGTGRSGKLDLKADQVVVQGVSPVVIASSISSTSFGAGMAGSIKLTARQIQLLDGGAISATAYTSGDAGQVEIYAQDSIQLSGEQLGLGSSINSSVLTTTPYFQQSLGLTATTGNAGSVKIITPRLTIERNGAVTVRNMGSGRGGKLEIQTTDLSLGDRGRISAEASGAGESGMIDLRSQRIILQDNAKISTAALGSGAAGDIFLHSQDLQLLDGSSLRSISLGQGQGADIRLNTQTLKLQQSEITAQAALGNGGEIVINAGQFLQLGDRSLISASAGGQGKGGNLELNAPLILGWGNSDIQANAVDGQGGEIRINTQALLGLTYRDRLTPDNDITATSDRGLQGSVQVNRLTIDPTAGLIQLPTELLAPQTVVADGCSARTGSRFVVTGRGGVPSGPNEVTSGQLWNDLRAIAAAPTSPAATAPQASPPLASGLVEAGGWRKTADQQIQLIAGPVALTGHPGAVNCASGGHTAGSGL